MLRRRRVADDAAPAFSTIVRTVHAALIHGFAPAQSNGAIVLGGSGQPSRTRSQRPSTSARGALSPVEGRSGVSRRYNRPSDRPATYAVCGPDDAEGIRCVAMDGELVGVPGTTSDAVAPCAAAVCSQVLPASAECHTSLGSVPTHMTSRSTGLAAMQGPFESEPRTPGAESISPVAIAL